MRACRTVVCALAMALLAMPAAQAQEEMKKTPNCDRDPDSDLCDLEMAAQAIDDDDTREKILQVAAAAGVVIALFSLFTGDDDEDSRSFGPATRQARPRVEFAPIYDPDSNMLMARGRIRF